VKIESDTSWISIVIRANDDIQDYDAYAIRPDGQIAHLSAQEAKVPPTACPGWHRPPIRISWMPSRHPSSQRCFSWSTRRS